MKIKDLKEKYPLVYKAAIINITNDSTENSYILNAFDWSISPEGHNFWSSINYGSFNKAEEICPHLFVKNMETTSPQNNLPKYWVVKRPDDYKSNPDWKKVIDYLNTINPEGHYSGITHNYYGVDGNSYYSGVNCCNNIKEFINNPIELSLDEFIRLYEGKDIKEFVLPEKWCIAVTFESRETLNKWRSAGTICDTYGYCLNKVGDFVGYWRSDKPKDFEEITFEQFKKYVLKEIPKEETMKEFTPISMRCSQEQWKLIKPKLDKLNLKISNLFNKERHCYLLNNFGEFGKSIISIGGNQGISNHDGEVYEEWNEQIFLESLGVDLSLLYILGDFEVTMKSDSPKTITLDNAYIVICNNAKETHEVARYIKGYGDWTHYKYVINHKGLLNCNYTDSNIFGTIPEKVKHFPILSFQEWKALFSTTKSKSESMKQSINTKTQEEYYALMKWCDDNNIKWNDSKASNQNNWKYAGDSCINLNLDTNSILTYDSLSFYKKENYQITSFEDFAKQNNIKIPSQQSISDKLILNSVEVPQEIVELMLQRQVEQGNARDISVFQCKYNSNKNQSGFTWMDTIEGYDFWNNVLFKKEFNVFFEKYPKKENKRIKKQEKFLGHWLMSPGVRIAHSPYFKADKEKPIKPSECFASEEPIIIKQQTTTNKLIII